MLFWHEYTVPKSLNHTLNPPPFPQQIRAQDPVCLFTSLTLPWPGNRPHYTPGTETLGQGTKCFSTSRESKQQPGPDATEKLTWLLPDSYRTKEFPQLSASRSVVFQLSYTSNQIIISRRVGAVRLYVMSLPLPTLSVKKPPPTPQRSLQLYCRTRQTTAAKKHFFLCLISWTPREPWCLKSQDINKNIYSTFRGRSECCLSSARLVR